MYTKQHTIISSSWTCHIKLLRVLWSKEFVEQERKPNALLPPSYSNLYNLPCCQLITMNLLIVVATYHDKISNLPTNYPWWSLRPTTLSTTLLTYVISPTWDATSSSFFSNISLVETNNPMSFIHVPKLCFGIKYSNKLLMQNNLE